MAHIWTEETTAALVEWKQTRDERLFASVLFPALEKFVYFGYRNAGRENNGDEANVMHALLACLEKLDTTQHPFAYLTATARYRVLTYYNRKRMTKELTPEIEETLVAEITEEQEEEREEIALMLFCLPMLKEREAQVLRMRYFDNLTQPEVGERLGLTKQRIQQLEVKALDRVRKMMQENVHTLHGNKKAPQDIRGNFAMKQRV